MKFLIYGEKKNVPKHQPVPLKPYVSEATREKTCLQWKLFQKASCVFVFDGRLRTPFEKFVSRMFSKKVVFKDVQKRIFK